MANFKILIIDDRFKDYSEEKKVLKEIVPEIKTIKNTETERIIREVEDADAVIVNLFPISNKIIEKMKKCRVISRYGVGYDNIDVSSATDAGIWVANVPDYSVEDVSDHALALLMSCVRKIPFKDRSIREGKWNLHDFQPVHRIKNRTIGIVGYGRIAKAFHRKISGLGFARVLVYDPYVSMEEVNKMGGEKVDFNTLLKNSDYISIHVPLNDKTRKMFSWNEFTVIRDRSTIINTSRGNIIDEEALIDALKTGKLECAGLDVFGEEPLPENHPFKEIDNVVLTDHTAYYSEESIKELKEKAAKNVLSVLKYGRPIYPVNEV